MSDPTRVALLEAVASAAQIACDGDGWAPLYAALDALAAHTPEPKEDGETVGRKVVQIAEWDDAPMALCGDGSIWWWSVSRQDWNQLPTIPATVEGSGRG